MSAVELRKVYVWMPTYGETSYTLIMAANLGWEGLPADLAITGCMVLNRVLFSGILWDLDKVLGQNSLALSLLTYLSGQIQTLPFLLSILSLPNVTWFWNSSLKTQQNCVLLRKRATWPSSGKNYRNDSVLITHLVDLSKYLFSSIMRQRDFCQYCFIAKTWRLDWTCTEFL